MAINHRETMYRRSKKLDNKRQEQYTGGSKNFCSDKERHRMGQATRTSHRHHHPFPHRTTDTRGDADRRPPCADDPGVEWPSSEQPTAGSPSPIIAWQDEMPLPL